MGGKPQILALRLRDGGEDIARLAGSGYEIDGTMAQGFEIFVPVGETRGDHDGNLAFWSLRDGEKVAVGPVREAALAENEADILLCEQIVTLGQA